MAVNASFLTRSVPVGITTFSGGLNSTDNPLFLKDNELSDLLNVDFSTNGACKKRNGYDNINASAFNSGATWTSVHWFKTATLEFIMGTCGNKLAKMDTFDGTWDDITGALTITAGNNNLFVWRNFNSKAYGTNNVDAPLKWNGSGNGSTWTMPTNVTLAKWVEDFENYMFIGNVLLSGTRKPTRLYWSNLDNAETWTATDFVELGLDDGEEITGLHKLGDRLVIFKENSIYICQFTGDADIPFVFAKTPCNMGCVSGYSIKEVKNGLVFLSQDGLYFFNGTTAEKISERITTTFDSMNKSRFQYATAGYQKSRNRYWLSLSDSASSTNNRVVTLDTYNNAFSLYSGMACNCFITLFDDDEKIYFGDYSGYVYQGDTGLNDNPAGVETAINGYFWTKWVSVNDFANQKAIPSLIVYYAYYDATIGFSYNYDLNNDEDYTNNFDTSPPGGLWDAGLWDEATWGSAGGSYSRRDLTGRGRLVRFKFGNSTLGETFQINGIAGNVHLETDV